MIHEDDVAVLDAVDEATLHDGRLLTRSPARGRTVVRRYGAWAELDVPALASLAERLGRPSERVDQALRARLGLVLRSPTRRHRG